MMVEICLKNPIWDLLNGFSRIWCRFPDVMLLKATILGGTKVSGNNLCEIMDCHVTSGISFVKFFKIPSG